MTRPLVPLARSTRLSALLVSVSLIAFSLPARAAQIRWVSGTAQTTFTTPGEAARTIAEYRNRSGSQRHIVVQFDTPVTTGQRADLAAAGLNLLAYVGDNAYFAAVADGAIDAAAIGRVRSLRVAVPVERNWKLHPSLVADEVFPWAVVDARDKELAPGQPADPIVAAYVTFQRDVDLLTAGTQAVQNVGGRVHSELLSINSLVIELPASAIKALADDDRVQYIEPPLPQLVESNDSNRIITQANTVQAAPYGLTGAGVSVLIYDGGSVRTTHVDFGGRATSRDGAAQSDHSTHVAGTVGGSGAASGGVRRGMAPGVTIESYAFEVPGGLSQGFLYTDPGDLEADYAQAISVHGVDISNNSIGTNTAANGFPCSWEGDYGITSALIDTIVRGDGTNPLFNTPFRVVWANGNERGSGACGSTYLTTAPPAGSKNIIAVGALNSNDDSVTYFTSWGPMDDGRLRPDVSAPGCEVGNDGGVTSTSSSSDTAYASKRGTSMAAPTVCGLGALFLEDFRVQYPGEPDPRNATLKAIFAHTAHDIEETGPDYKSGYGSVRVQNAIDLMRAGNFLENTVSQGDVYFATVAVAPGSSELKVTLAWDDFPGAPNANPVLVNDLDLKVFDPSGTRHYPWTLNPASPATPAVRTQEDHINNIEQVFVATPTAGAWRVEVHGTAVPQGPQPFSLVGSPLLVNCTDAGIVNLDRAKYACSSVAGLRVVDCGLNTSDLTVDTVTVTVASSSEPAGETFLLTETAPETATFVGSAPLETSDSVGVIQVAPGDTLMVTYVDADDGAGGTNVTVTDTATVDCTPPVITGVQATDIEPRSATISFNTNEPARSTVRYGASCGALNASIAGGALNTAHSLGLTSLVDATTYFFAIDAEDEAGNTVTDNGGGACYAFTTPDIPNFFTEEFGSDNDLANKLLTFTPNATVDQYFGCVEDITALPTDPAGGTTFPFDDDAYATVDLTGGASVLLYGVSYTRFYPSSNGYIAFLTGDEDYSETLAEHFAQPRISAVYDDLNPTNQGSVSYKQLADRVAITWFDVPQYNTTDSNTFQIELFYDGTIRIAYLTLGATDGIAGLSAGNGLDPDYFETDLSAMGACGPRPPVASSMSTGTPANVPVNIVLTAADDDLPDPPAALAYTIMSLPNKATLSDPQGGVINAAPYTLLNGGATVAYAPLTNLYGADAFNFKVNDGGTPPDGGDSNEATVAVTIIADPPVTQDMNINVDIDTSSVCILSASDPNGDPLDVVITTLPAHGVLRDLNGSDITSAPYTLLAHSKNVRYTPASAYAGNDSFAFKALDGIFESNESTADVLVIAHPPVIESDVLPDGLVGQPYGPLQLAKSGGQPNVNWALITDPIYVEYDLGTCGFTETGVAQNWAGDDVVWDYDLPFTFPFYGTGYDSVRVWSNGMLDFALHNGSSHNNSTSLLATNVRIAPLWDDLKTNATGLDIFIDDSVTGEVTFRWKAATYVGSYPANFAATLHDNGDIVFHYGSGNTPITPTVGVSVGDGSNYTLSAHDGATSLTYANSKLLRIPVSLPDGMSIDAAGIVSGTPTEGGTFEPVVRLTDSLQRSDTQAIVLRVVGGSGVAGDYDGDGDMDLADFAVYLDCLFGPNVTPAPSLPASAQSCLGVFDANADGDVDLQDMAQIESGANP